MIKVISRCFPDVIGEAGDQEAMVESHCLRYVDRSAVQPRAPVLAGSEQLISRGIIDDTEDATPLVLESDGHAIGWVAMREVGGPI